MKYTRRYLQFNDLVFDGYDMIQDSDGGVDFKVNSTEKSFGHGSYLPLKRNYLFAKEQSVSLTLKLRMKKLPCDARPFYVDFAIGELTKPGKLWKVQNGQIMWANAVVQNFTPQDDARDNQFEIDIDFLIPEGVWHKADKQKTFLAPYDVCSFMDCKNYRVVQPCCGDSCVMCDEKEIQQRRDDSCDCCCEVLSKDMALCYNLGKIPEFYSRCASGYQLTYDCDLAQEFFGDEYLGYRFCIDDCCEGIIAGNFYSDTDIPTDNISVILTGKMHNPWVTINDNRNIIQGDYDGTLTITESGDVYYNDGCCEKLLDPSVWVIPEGEYGWEVHQGFNSLVVNMNVCGLSACAYVQVDALSI